MGTRVAPAACTGKQTPTEVVSEYGAATYCKSRPPRELLKEADGSVSNGHAEEGLKRLKDVGDKRTLITSAEIGLVQQYRELKLAGQEVLQVDFPYHYSSILYACYGNQYKILQLVEREFCSGMDELVQMHATRCWVGKNSAMVAAYQGHLETMLYIIDLDLQGKFGYVDLFTQRDVMGKTAMDWAASQGHTDTIEVLLIRSLYKLLPANSSHPLVLKTRYKLVSLLADLSRHCRDYDPNCHRRFFQEVLALINFNPTVAAAAAAIAAGKDGDIITFNGTDGSSNGNGVSSSTRNMGGGEAGGNSSRRPSLKSEAGIDSTSCDEIDGQQESGCTAVRPSLSGGSGGIQRAAAAGVSSKEGVKWAATSGAGSGHHRTDSLLVRPSGTPKDVHVTVAMLMDVVTSAYHGGLNCMGVIMYIQTLLRQARYYEDLMARCTAWEVQLLDTCRNKSEVQAILTPTYTDPSEPVGYALTTFDKAFLSHKYIQQIFTEKWDTMGVTDFANSIIGLAGGSLTLVAAFASWVALSPISIILRAFFSPVEDFFQRGKVIVDSRFPWHVPLYRWLLAQCSLLTFVMILSYRVFSEGSEATLSAAVSPLNTFLAIWCLAIIVEELQEFLEEGRTAYMASGWNIMDITMSAAFLLQYLLRLGVVVTHGTNVGALLVVNDLLAAAALMAWFRVVSVFELSSAIGPLIQMMKQMLLQDVTRFALLVLVILLGFSVGMQALFQDVCLEVGPDNKCARYSNWAYDWQKQGLVGGITFLQYVALGNMQVTDFEQKRVTGIIFYLIFAVVTSILMLNLFIAMLADTYARVSNKAQVEFRYRKAVIMASFSRREAISPPFNLLHLLCGAVGNTLRQIVFGRGRFSAVRLRKNEDTPLFAWYFPQGSEAVEVEELKRRVVGDFLRAVRVTLVKDRLQADLPILLRHLVQNQGDVGDDGEEQEFFNMPPAPPGPSRPAATINSGQ